MRIDDLEQSPADEYGYPCGECSKTFRQVNAVGFEADDGIWLCDACLALLKEKIEEKLRKR